MRGIFQIDGQLRPRVLLAITVIGLAIAGSIALVLRFAANEGARDLYFWQTKLNIIAESRLSAVNQWVNTQFSELQALADNASLQVYMTELEQSSGNRDGVTDEPYQSAYLRNLLDITSLRSGFIAPDAATPPPANVERTGSAGLALLNPQGNIIVSTNNLPPLAGALKQFLDTAAKGERSISEVYLNSDGSPSLAFSIPIFAVQGEKNATSQVGTILGIRPIAQSLFPLLIQPGTTEKTLETLLVAPSASAPNTIMYISPTKDGAPPLSKRLDANNADLESVFASQQPGQFAIRHDYSFNQVLVTGRKVANTSWTLVEKVNRDEALAESDTQRTQLVLICLSFIGLVCAVMLAIWRHGSYVRESKAALRYRQLAMDFEGQKNLLSLVTDYKPEAMILVDAKNHIRFANLEAARQAEMPPERMLGKPLVSVLGKTKADAYVPMNSTALASNSITSATHRNIDNDGKEYIIQSRHIPITHIPVTDDKSTRNGVLILEQDITEPIAQRERFLRTLDALIETLLAIMDKRDPHTADHSSRVARLARSIAEEMQLSSTLIDTAKIAGRLMNIGRMFIPLELLHKVEELTAEEKKTVRSVRNASVDLLKDIEFEGPVIDTIRQSQERWDGTGPLGLHGNDILVTARIVAVANAFVSMRSPRAYRLLRTLDDALNVLTQESGTRYDRAVVVALGNYMENRGGREVWKEPETIAAIWVG